MLKNGTLPHDQNLDTDTSFKGKLGYTVKNPAASNGNSSDLKEKDSRGQSDVNIDEIHINGSSHEVHDSNGHSDTSQGVNILKHNENELQTRNLPSSTSQGSQTGNGHTEAKPKKKKNILLANNRSSALELKLDNKFLGDRSAQSYESFTRLEEEWKASRVLRFADEKGDPLYETMYTNRLHYAAASISEPIRKEEPVAREKAFCCTIS